MVSHQRTQRQEQISGWSQEHLSKANIGIIGSGNGAQAVAAYCAGLGVGALTLVDTARAGSGILIPPGECQPSEETIMTLQNRLREMNPDITVDTHCRAPLNPRHEKEALSLCDVIVDTVCDPGWTSRAFRTAIDSNRTLLYLQLKGTDSEGSLNGYLVGNRTSVSQMDAITELTSREETRSTGHSSLDAVIQGAMATDRIRSAVMPLSTMGECSERPSAWPELSAERKQSYLDPAIYENHDDNTYNEHIRIPSEMNIPTRMIRRRKKKALVIGAGGIGTQVTIALSSQYHHDVSPKVVHIADPDHVSFSNIHRMTWYTEDDASTSRNKAKVLAEQLMRDKPDIRAKGVTKVISGDSGKMLSKKYDYIFICLDNPEHKRDIVSYLVQSGHDGIMTYGTVGPFNAEMGAYQKGKGPCPNCQNDNFTDSIDAHKTRATSCSDVGLQNIVMMNALVGGCMVDTAYRIAAGIYIPGGERLRLSSQEPRFGMHLIPHEAPNMPSHGCPCRGYMARGRIYR